MNGYKVISMLLGAVLLISLNLQAKEVKNFYVNGINNEEQDVIESAKKLTEAFTEKYGHILVNTHVDDIYNESFGVFPDLIESGIQKHNLENLVTGLAGAGLIASSYADDILTQVSTTYQRELLAKSIHFHLLMGDEEYRNKLYGSVIYVNNSADILLTGPGSTYPPQIPNEEEIRQFDELAFLLDLGMSVGDLIELKLITGLSTKFNDLTTSVKYYYGNMGYYVTQQNITHDKILTELNKVLDIGGSVNVVAHSQGNLFANDVINVINQESNTRLLSVGSPDANLPNTGSYVNLKEDLVVRSVQPNLGWNYTNIPLDFWMNEIEVLPSFGQIFFNETKLNFKNKEVNLDELGHNFITAYLKPNSDSREAIIDAMAKHYVEMGGQIHNVYSVVDGDADCDLYKSEIFSESGISYEAKRYGDKCLFFASDHIVEYDVNSLDMLYHYDYFGNDLYSHFKMFRLMVNNIAILKEYSHIRDSFGLTLNLDGNIGCTIDDNCVNGEISTSDHCTNLFQVVMKNDYVEASFSDNVCRYIFGANVIEYNIDLGKVQVIDLHNFEPMTTQDFKLKLEFHINENDYGTTNLNCIDIWFNAFQVDPYTSGYTPKNHMKTNCFYINHETGESISYLSVTGEIYIEHMSFDEVYMEFTRLLYEYMQYRQYATYYDGRYQYTIDRGNGKYETIYYGGYYRIPYISRLFYEGTFYYVPIYEIGGKIMDMGYSGPNTIRFTHHITGQFFDFDRNTGWVSF